MEFQDRIKEETVTSKETVTEDHCEDNHYSEDDHYSTVGDNWAESILAFIAYAILIVGVSLSILIGVLLIIDNNDWDNIIGKLILIAGPIVTLIIWANLMILINISNNVRQIKKEQRRKKF